MVQGIPNEPEQHSDSLLALDDHGSRHLPRHRVPAVRVDHVGYPEAIGEGYDDTLRLRQTWLVVMSLLVSTVGVVNSMLMSVTERYREIGTMKCLGALDKLVVKLFLIEAVLTGLVASVLGSIIGITAMLFVHWLRFGGRFGVAFSGAWQHLLLNLAAGVTIGTVLALVAAWYPAWRAAKMPPAAALRTEV